MRFDVYRPSSATSGLLALDVQSDFLSDLRTRLVVPLRPIEGTVPIRRLHPTFDIGGRRYVMSTDEMLSMPATELRNHVASLAEHHIEIVGAIDFLLQGY